MSDLLEIKEIESWENRRSVPILVAIDEEVLMPPIPIDRKFPGFMEWVSPKTSITFSTTIEDSPSIH
jgi:hypothetical protein